jgi:ferredoxin-NADP reductase
MTRYPLRVTHRILESPDTVSLGFGVPQDLRHVFRHRPGQFVSLAMDVDGQSLERSYSISSLPDIHPWLRITVKRLPAGKVSGWLVEQVQAGTVIELAAPRGRFFDPPANPVHAVLLGAGSGIAPLVPIARHLSSAGTHQVSLICGQRTEADLILRDEIEALGTQSNCRVSLRLTRPKFAWAGELGRIDARYIATRLPAWRDTGLPLVFYVCGPEPFMGDVEDALRAGGVTAESIRKESFVLTPEEDTGEPGIAVLAAEADEAGDCIEIRASASGEEFEVQPESGESLLASLLRAGAPVPFSCQEGTCASCIARLKRGAVELKRGALQILPQQDIDKGLILACLSHPQSARIHIDFDDL